VKSVVLIGTSQIGLTAQETRGLYANLDHVYGSIASDALFKDIKSALPYCLSDKRASQGHYFGKQDSGFRIAHVQSIASKLAKRLPHFEFHALDGDHFFLLSKREEPSG